MKTEIFLAIDLAYKSDLYLLISDMIIGEKPDAADVHPFFSGQNFMSLFSGYDSSFPGDFQNGIETKNGVIKLTIRSVIEDDIASIAWLFLDWIKPMIKTKAFDFEGSKYLAAKYNRIGYICKEGQLTPDFIHLREDKKGKREFVSACTTVREFQTIESLILGKPFEVPVKFSIG